MIQKLVVVINFPDTEKKSAWFVNSPQRFVVCVSTSLPLWRLPANCGRSVRPSPSSSPLRPPRWCRRRRTGQLEREHGGGEWTGGVERRRRTRLLLLLLLVPERALFQFHGDPPQHSCEAPDYSIYTTVCQRCAADDGLGAGAGGADTPQQRMMLLLLLRLRLSFQEKMSHIVNV